MIKIDNYLKLVKPEPLVPVHQHQKPVSVVNSGRRSIDEVQNDLSSYLNFKPGENSTEGNIISFI